tara:strand:+ start:8424 stop:12218 length:3795 start_codon:yes stop_codon:yes gene_type:complete
MKLITREHLLRWADTTLSKEALPYLISRLIRATSPKSTVANIPWGSATYIGGWDGIVTCESDTGYVPKGISLWEFGTNSDIKGKADSDYKKRKDEPLGFEPKECVFFFITPRLWTKKDDWIAEKKAENHWKDVIVYDSVDLEQWLDNALSVSRWFAAQDGVGAYPFDGIMTADEFWEEWSFGPSGIELLPKTVIAGREIEKMKLLDILNDKPSLKAVKASTKNEAIAFIIACAKTFEDVYAQEFFSKALVVDTEGNFRGIRINTNSSLNLIPRFEDYQPLYSAVGRGHHVIVPLGADDDFNQEIILLPTIDRDGQIDALTESGVDKNDAEKFSRESGRNITILKKLLGFPHNKTKWLQELDLREIVPALLLGRWDETFTGDIELIEKLSGQKYTDYRVTLYKWKNLEEAPILQIGETWRLTSPLDLWTNLASQLTQEDFQQLQECFAIAFKDGNPVAKPEDDSFAARFNQKRTFSSWSREGLTQSLILVARLGDSLEIPNIGNPQGWVDAIISDLLKDETGELWISLDYELPLISEASPDSFLRAAKISLDKDEPEIMDLFNEEDGFLHKNSHHTGLLWALEGLAWLPDYLRGVSLILLKLARLDPGGNLSNRPINSIVEIYKPWHYQTLAPFEKRMQILKYVTKQEKETGWTLLIRMLPNSHGVGQPTHKMRWRMFDMNTNISRTYQEIWNTHTAVIEMLIELFDNDEKKFAELIKATTDLGPKDRARVLNWADEVCQDVEQKEFTTWETIRGILYRHRSHPDTKWALPEAELSRFEKLYHKLEPKDVVKKNIWLFDKHHLEFPEGYIYKKDADEKRYELRQKQVDETRKNAVKKLIDELGVEKTLSLRNEVKEHWILGDALARLNLSDEDVFTVCETLYDENPYLRFIHSFIYRKSVIEGFDWVKTLFNNLKEKGFGDEALSNLLIPLDQNQELWNFVGVQTIEAQNFYWENVYPRFFHATTEEKVFGLQRLLEYKRFFSAIDVTYLKPEDVPSKILVEILEKAAIEKANEKASFKGHEVERIFEELDKRDDVQSSKLIQLEWYYLALLDSYGSHRNPKNLEEELTNNPSFFIEVLKWLYLPKDKELLEKEREGVSDDIMKSRGKQSYHLLNAWKKIPGMKEDNFINKNELLNWINTARKLAKEVDRLDVADAEIGKLLAQYPENVSEWPQETIFQIIEEINTESLKRNYSSAMFNKRSFSSRAAFAGGDIERDKAAYFQKLADEFNIQYPNVAEIFMTMAKSYLHDAKQMDDDAERNKLEY